MRTVLDDGLCTFFRALAAQVGHALFGHDDVDAVFRVVVVRHHRDDGADASFLGHGRAGEDGDIGIAGEVAAAANAVHHLRAADVCGVHIAIDVRLDGRVDGYDAQSAHHFGAVGDFGRAQHQFVAEEVHVVVDALQAVVGHGQRAGAAKLDASLADEADD